MSTVEPIRNIDDLKKVEKILEGQGLRNLLIFAIGTNCGLRISDILSLNVGDVKNKNYIQLIEKKTGKSKKIQINSKLKPLLNTFTKGRKVTEPLFLTIFKNRMDRSAAYRIINYACNKAGIEANIGTHTLRKTFGYHYYKKYKDVVMLQKIFNHSHPEVTLRYIGLEQDKIDESYIDFIL